MIIPLTARDKSHIHDGVTYIKLGGRAFSLRIEGFAGPDRRVPEDHRSGHPAPPPVPSKRGGGPPTGQESVIVEHASARSPDHPAPPPAALASAPTALTPSPGAAVATTTDPAALSLLASASADQPVSRMQSQPLGPESREYARCDLCGEHLGEHAGHFHMVSPLTARHVSVCRTCRRAALSEGYRPRA